MTAAYQCDECRKYFQGGPLHSISLNGTLRWVDFDSTRCLAFWVVKQMGGTDLLDIHSLSQGTDESGKWSVRAKPDSDAIHTP